MYTTLTHELYHRQLLECLYTDLAIRVKIARVIRTANCWFDSITNSLSGLSTLAAMTWFAEPRSTNVWVMVGHETQSQAHVKHEKLITLGSSRSTQLLGDGRRLENYSTHAATRDYMSLHECNLGRCSSSNIPRGQSTTPISSTMLLRRLATNIDSFLAVSIYGTIAACPSSPCSVTATRRSHLTNSSAAGSLFTLGSEGYSLLPIPFTFDL
jgi:hypothetical protein